MGILILWWGGGRRGEEKDKRKLKKMSSLMVLRISNVFVSIIMFISKQEQQ